MRGRGTGSIYHRERDGLWCGQLRLSIDGQRVRRTIYGHTKAEVEAGLKALRLQHGVTPVPRRPTTMDGARRLATHTTEQWVAKRDAVGCCIYCGSTGPLEKDHAIPVVRGGDDGIGNVVPACATCNSSKGTSTAAEFVKYLAVLAR